MASEQAEKGDIQSNMSSSQDPIGGTNIRHTASGTRYKWISSLTETLHFCS